MIQKSFLTCRHTHVQEYTDYCFDCGYNRNMTNSEYLAELRRRVIEADPVIKEIKELEKKLGIVP